MVEQAGIEDLPQRHAAEIGLDQPASGLSARMILRAASDPAAGIRDLVEHDDIGELDLLDQQVDQRALVAFAGRSRRGRAGNRRAE
jgi:hypothetical protein